MKKYTLEEIREKRLCLSPMTKEQYKTVCDAFEKAYPDKYKINIEFYYRENGFFRFFPRYEGAKDWYGSSKDPYDDRRSTVKASGCISYDEIDFVGYGISEDVKQAEELNEMAQSLGINFKF